MGNEFLTLKADGIYNGLATSIVFVSNAQYCQRKKKWIIPEGMKPETLCIIKGGNKVLRSGTQTTEETCIQRTTESGRNILLPIYEKKGIFCDPIPEGYEYVIVTSLYANTYQKLHGEDKRLYTLSDTVFSEDGRNILGARGICPAY